MFVPSRSSWGSAAVFVGVLVCLPAGLAQGDAPAAVVELDASEVPELRPWGETARDAMQQWHPRIANLLPTKGFTPPAKAWLRLRKSDRGIGGTSGQRIEVSSRWIEKHPEDVGLVIHEMVHVIQAYPSPEPGWVTEGIADYVRWAIYEGKPQSWFPTSNRPRGYRESYQVAAGFFLWLETDAAPGIVKKLNTSMRNRAYDEGIFLKETGKSLDALWDEYVKSRAEKRP